MAAPCDGCCWCFCSISVFGLADLILVLLLATPEAKDGLD
jgi:hypothetical protein